MVDIHPGSWTIPGTNIRLPDIGLTEKIADIFGQSRNPQGGSQLRQGTIFNVGNVPYTVNTPIKTSQMTYTPDVLGGYYTYATTTPVKTTQPSQPQSSSSGGGGGGGGGGLIGITPDEALRRGWDVNKLPSGYYLIRPEPAGPSPDQIRSNIEAAYSDFIRRLDEMAGLYPQWQQEDIQRLETSKQQGIQGLDISKQGSLEKLQTARQQVEQKQQQAINDILSQLRQLLKASQMRAGLLGAGWSSATQQVLPAVLGKQAARSSAQVARGALEQLNQIAQKEVDVKSTYDLAKNQLEQDFTQKMQEVADKYRQLKQWIETEKANASWRKLDALNRLDEALLTNAINTANAIRQEMVQRQQALENWALQRIAQLQDYKIQLGQMGNFSPVELTYQALQGLGGLQGGTSAGWGEDIYGSMLDLAKKRREQLGL